MAKFQRLYGFSLATLRYHITFLNSPKQLTPSMPYDEFLPPAAAASLNRKMGAPKKQQSRMEFDLITGMTRFSSPEFTCTMMVVDDKLMLWTNISLGVLQNSQMTISELGTFLTLKIKVPPGSDPPPPPLLPPVSPPPSLPLIWLNHSSQANHRCCQAALIVWKALLLSHGRSKRFR